MMGEMKCQIGSTLIVLLFIASVRSEVLLQTFELVPIDGVYADSMGIMACWEHLLRTLGYHVTMAGANRTLDVTRRNFIVKGKLPKATYTFQVRQWNGFKHTKLPKTFTVEKRLNRGETYKPVDTPAGVKSTVRISWKSSERSNSRLNCVTYALATCLKDPTYGGWTTSGTLARDVIFLNYLNATRKPTEKVSIENYTIRYDKKHKALLRYDNVSCRVATATPDVVRFKVADLASDAKYSYTVFIYPDGHVVGKYMESNFTVTERPPEEATPPGTIFTGVAIYGMSCFVLIIALIVSFVIAYYCKWERLMSDVAIKKARMQKEESRRAQMDLLKPPLLTTSTHVYNNGHTPNVETK